MSAARKKAEARGQKAADMADAAFDFHLLLLADAVSWTAAYLANYQRSGLEAYLLGALQWLRTAKTNLALAERWAAKGGAR